MLSTFEFLCQNKHFWISSGTFDEMHRSSWDSRSYQVSIPSAEKNYICEQLAS